MSKQTYVITEEQLQMQLGFCDKIAAYWNQEGIAPTAYVETYGCQQNVSDGERIKGMLAEMGFGFTDTPDNADLILFNTCAVRGHAEDRVLGNVGALKAIKQARPQTIIALCGCMVQQEKAANILNQKFKHIDMVFGTHSLYKFPEILYTAMKERVLDVIDCDGYIAEDIPMKRDDKFRAWVSIMYGCNNFCSYCIVPYVRGRERSREPKAIIEDIR